MKVFTWFRKGLNVGHASLTLENGTHISWWPSDDESGKSKKEMPKSAKPCPEQTFAADCAMEDRKPDETYTLSGFDEDRIKIWWDQYRHEKDWKLLSTNCCKVVYEALVKGGAPEETKLVWTPAGIDGYVRKIAESQPR